MERDARQQVVADYEKAGYARRELEQVPFWAFRERRRRQETLEGALARIENSTPAAADMVLLRAFTDIRAQESYRNPFHPEVRPRLGELARRAVSASFERPAPTSHSAYIQGEPWSSYPSVAALLNTTHAQEIISGIIDELESVAADPVFLFRPYITNEGSTGYRVQHKASGLRGDFTVTKTWAPDIGSVYSKPYRLRSIDPDNNPGELLHNWQRYVGLGIGTRLYQAAAQLMPEIRWLSSAASPHAHGARERLHQVDPWRWNVSGCDWCFHRNINWTEAGQQTFTGHPRLELISHLELVDVSPQH